MEHIEIFKGLAELLQSSVVDRYTDFVDLPDGRKVRARFMYDMSARLEDDGDWFGKIEWSGSKYEKGQRPSGFDGSAVVVHTDNASRLWLMPPKDVEGEALKSLISRVKAYYRDEWTYMVVELQVMGVPCTHCGASKTESEYLGAVESDATVDYLAATLHDMAGW